MAKKYIVDLSKDEKAELVLLTQKGRPGARKILATCSCFCNPWRVGGISKSLTNAPNRISLGA
jgi:hypothetical protein